MEKTLNQTEVHKKGLEYVTDHLRGLGWNVKAEPRASKGINIRAEQGSRRITIQVKSLTATGPRGSRTGLGKNFTGFTDFVIVCRDVTKEPECFILTRDEVNHWKVLRPGGKYFLNDCAQESFREKWGKL
jgi:hypothetical protein